MKIYHGRTILITLRVKLQKKMLELSKELKIAYQKKQ